MACLWLGDAGCVFLVRFNALDGGGLLFFGMVGFLAFFLNGLFDAHGTGFEGRLFGDGVPLF